MASSCEATADQREWLAAQFDGLTTELEVISPSQWAEQKRYLPPSVTALPGPYRFEVAPYLKEIVDCLSVDSPIREVAVMKGVQICATVGILENAIGYYIDAVKTSPVMLVTADSELAKLRMESYITPMLQHSGLEHLIKSADENNARKRGKTDKKVEWIGGGFLIPFGAQNANKLRSVSVEVLLNDEIDAWPDVVGKDGDPLKLVRDRTAAYESSRKILDISTPLVTGQSKIEARFKQGDQRRYYVCCLKCGFAQVLRWKHTDPDTGTVSGMVWKMDGERLVPGSVRYVCQNPECCHEHINDDKQRLLSPENGAQWVPTATPAHPHIRSYHISALYSPVGMQTWEACVQKWLEAWDVERDAPRDLSILQVVYNNVFGDTYTLHGEKVRFEQVSLHRRHAYHYGQIPNAYATQFCGGPVLLLTCAVDVHKDNLKVAIFGWCRDRRAILIDYHKLEGNPEQLDDDATWGELRRIKERVYTADDGKRYSIVLTLVDSGYFADQAYQFAAEYEIGIAPIKGRDTPSNSAKSKEFSEFTSPMGTTGYLITVDFYKDRWSGALRRGWDGQSTQPTGHFNAPLDVTDAQLKELTVETKRERLEPGTNRRIGFAWHRPSGAANELWDLLIYNSAALDLVALDYCRGREFDVVNWNEFYAFCESGGLLAE
jgi:phage terminase large subunit GpA-like protein